MSGVGSWVPDDYVISTMAVQNGTKKILLDSEWWNINVDIKFLKICLEIKLPETQLSKFAI